MTHHELIVESSTPDPAMLERAGIYESPVPEHLKPLPICLFCGAGQYLARYIYHGVYIAYVYCEMCMASGPMTAHKDPVTALDEAVEAYKTHP